MVFGTNNLNLFSSLEQIGIPGSSAVQHRGAVHQSIDPGCLHRRNHDAASLLPLGVSEAYTNE